jgi:hypothetical protein
LILKIIDILLGMDLEITPSAVNVSSMIIEVICFYLLEDMELHNKEIDQEEENWDDHFQSWDSGL